MIGDEGGDAEGTPSRWSGARILLLGRCEQEEGWRAGEDAGFSGGESVCSEGGVQLPVCIQIGAQSRLAFAAYYLIFVLHCCPQTKAGHSFIHSLTSL